MNEKTWVTGEVITADELNRLERKAVDYIIERGQSGIWFWEKWASGKAVCWGQYRKDDFSFAHLWQDGWYYGTVSPIPYPKGLFVPYSFPYCLQSLANSERVTFLTVSSNTGDMAEYTPELRLIATQSGTIQAQGVNYYVIGHWK